MIYRRDTRLFRIEGKSLLAKQIELGQITS